jgi:RNA polymerase sigma factor (TIGR02999 family)
MDRLETTGSGEVTRLLRAVGDGDRAAFDRLLPLVYDELRAIARRQMKREFGERTLETTGLVHEAYLKLAESAEVDWQGRSHFFAIAARAMRQILVDEARRKATLKRGGDRERVSLSDADPALEEELEELLALDEALDELDQIDPRARHVVECRFFAGMTEEEVASLLDVTVRTVQRDWARARAWLHGRLYRDGE